MTNFQQGVRAAMNLREQEYVLAIAKYQSLKGAAEFLSVSPPTLSVFLSSLEQNLGVPLFNRFGKKFVPTEVGAAYIRYAQEMCFLNRQWEAQLSNLKHGEHGGLRLGLHPRRTTYLLPAALRELTILHPDLNVKLYEGSSEELFHLLLDGEVDLIVNNQRHPSPVLEFLPFYRDRLVAVLSPLHPLASQAVSLPGCSLPWIDLSLFAGETFILQLPDQSSRLYTDQALAYAGIHPNRCYLIENLEAAAQMAAEGLGIAFNFLGYIQHFSYPKPVSFFLVGDPDIFIDYYIIHRKDAYLAPQVSDFITILKKQIAQHPLLLLPPQNQSTFS